MVAQGTSTFGCPKKYTKSGAPNSARFRPIYNFYAKRLKKTSRYLSNKKVHFLASLRKAIKKRGINPLLKKFYDEKVYFLEFLR